MAPKRTKSAASSNPTGGPSGNRAWENGLISATLEEEEWKVSIAFVVENQQEDEVHTRALSQAVWAPQRRLFSLVSWDNVLQQVNELGKLKKGKDAPPYYEVTEVVKTLLDNRETLPLPLVAKLLKFQFLSIRQKERQRREVARRLPEDKAKQKAIKSTKAKPSSARGSAKGKKAPEAPPPVKEDTTLKRRGEEQESNIYIDDEPDDGAQHYIIVVGVYQPQILVLLADLGVQVSSVIRISSQSYASLPANQVPEDTPQEAIEAEAQRKCSLSRSLEVFWKYLDPVLESGKSGSALCQVARLHHLVTESDQPADWSNAEQQLTYAAAVFESVACLMYDCLDWRRQHQLYLQSLRLIHVPAVGQDRTAVIPSSASEVPAAAIPSTPTAKKKGQADEIHSTVSLPPPTPLQGEVESQTVTLDVDMRYYNDLLCDVPAELLTVPVILHCMLEQVVATEKDLIPPSELVPDPRADGLDPTIADHLISLVDSLTLSEKEKKNLYNTFLLREHDQQTTKGKTPHLLHFHDKTGERICHAQPPKSLNLVSIEEAMLRKLPMLQRLQFQQMTPEINSRRLAQIHELMHFCNTDPPSWEGISRAFTLLTLESLKLTGLDEFGDLQGSGKMLGNADHIPWDNPAAFAREARRTFGIRKMSEKTGAARTEGDRGQTEDSDENREALQSNLREIQKTQKRCVSDWSYSEHCDPPLLLQVIHEAAELYRCMDSYYHTQNNSLLIVLHNPMTPHHHSQESWDMALHSNVSFRNYLELVADSIATWVQEEEEKYQEKMELEALKHAQAQESQGGRSASRDPSPNKKKARKSASPKKSRSPKGSRSRPGSQGEEAPTPDPAKSPFIREDSLKAWKIEQDRLMEEERLKQEKKNAKGRKSSGKRKAASRERSDSRESRGSSSDWKKSSKENSNQEEVKSTELGSETTINPPEAPKTKFKFIGYDMGDDLIQVSGGCRCLYPTDGGQIEVEHTHFEKGSSYVKVKVMKDGHMFLVHIVNPEITSSGEPAAGTREGQNGSPSSSRRSVSEFGSLSATLQSGIQLSLSHYGASGRGPEEKDPQLEAMLTFPSIHTPSMVPTPPTQPPPVPTSKGQKSPRGKSPRAVRVKTPPAPPVEETPRTPELPVEDVRPPVTPPPKPAPAGPAFQSLNVSYPNGLLLTFRKEDTEDLAFQDGSTIQRLLARLTYPLKGRKAQVYKGRKIPEISETCRVITPEGGVIRSMLDGSVEVLFPDGSVRRSPDPGRVVEPAGSAAPPVEEAPSFGLQATDSLPDSREQKSETLPENKRGKGGQKAVPAPPAVDRSEPAEAPLHEPQPAAPPDLQPRTWITTSSTGEQVERRGSQKLELTPLQNFSATDPVTGAVMTTREDRVVTVISPDGTIIVEHADGTRMTTYYQNVDIPLPGDHEETGEVPQSVRKRVKYIRVENSQFVTIILNCEEGAIHAVSGDGTEILATPHGEYQVTPPQSGSLAIDRFGQAVYSPQTSSSMQENPPRPEVLTPASYILSHTQRVICEVMDPEGNLFQVMVNGSTSVVNADGGAGEEEETEQNTKTSVTTTKLQPEVYDLHAPRFFIVNPDGSGSELLRNREVEDYLSSCYCDPAIAVLREPTQEVPGVQTITVLQPVSESSPWLMRKELNSIVPPNLLSRKWDTFPSPERITPGPSLGVGIWKGLSIGEPETRRPRPPVLKCPSVLKIRQLHQYEPINKEVREKLELSLKAYIDNVLKKEEELQERDVKEPRREEEKAEATKLLELVLALSESQECPQTPSLGRLQGDIASLYESSVSPPPPPPPAAAKPQRSAQDWDTLRQEIREQKENLAAIRQRDIPPYFHSEMGQEFLQRQVPNLDLLSKLLPPSPVTQEEEESTEELTLTVQEEQPGRRGDSWERAPTYVHTDHSTVPPAGSGQTDMSPDGEAASETFLRPELITAQVYRPLCRSLNVTVTGEPRREKVRLPAAILSAKPPSVPTTRVRDWGMCRASSASLPAGSGVTRVPRGFQLLPAAVRFGALREGHAYAMTVTMKNVGPEFLRFRVKPPPPSSSLRITYSPGPVAAGMRSSLEVEMFAMAVGLEGPAECSHCIEIQSEVETLFLPVTATVMTEGVYKRQAVGGASHGLAPGVKLVSTNPEARLELLKLRKAAETGR